MIAILRSMQRSQRPQHFSCFWPDRLLGWIALSYPAFEAQRLSVAAIQHQGRAWVKYAAIEAARAYRVRDAALEGQDTGVFSRAEVCS